MNNTDSPLQWLTDYATAVKHGSLKPFTLTERKARAATRNQPWGPTGTEISRLAELSFSPSDCAAILQVVELRLDYPPKKWRNVYKGLTLLEYLLRHGSEQCVVRARGELVHRLEALAAEFRFVGPDGRDTGVNVRHRAQAILALVRDEPRLSAEREAHAKKRGQAYQGFGAFDVAAHNGSPTMAGTWQAAPQDGGHLSRQGSGGDADAQPASPDYRAREAGEALRAAGETKGVSMEENQRYLAALKRLLELPCNKACADCGGSADGGRSTRPSWASINCGVFVCMRCAGVHRGMGVHVSKIRSCSLDTWLPEQVEFMARTGNQLGNAHWEAKLSEQDKPRSFATLQELEAFIRRKYVAKEFAAGVWPPQQLANGPEVLAILADCLPSPRARELLASQQRQADQKAAEVQRSPKTSTAAVEVNLIDFDPEPVAADDGQPGAAADSLALAVVDPMRSLQDVFVLHSATSSATANPMAPPSQPAADLGSWDMGAALARQQTASQAVEAAPQTATSTSPPPAPHAATRAAYSPPWAPQPHLQANGGHAHMQIVPAGAAYDPTFHGSNHSTAAYSAQPSLVGNPFNSPGAASYYAHATTRSPPQQQPKQHTARPMLSPRPPASPAEAKAQELISSQLWSFNLHAETVSAVHPPARPAPAHSPATVPLQAMRSSR